MKKLGLIGLAALSLVAATSMAMATPMTQEETTREAIRQLRELTEQMRGGGSGGDTHSLPPGVSIPDPDPLPTGSLSMGSSQGSSNGNSGRAGDNHH